MRNLFRLTYKLALMGLGVVLLIACGSPSSSGTWTSSGKSAPHTALVAIPRGQGLFALFILVVQPGTLATRQNNESKAHQITISSSNPQAFSLLAAADQNVSLTFTKPGL